MSSPAFPPAVWGQFFFRAAKRCAAPLLLLAGALSLPALTHPAHAQNRVEGQILVRSNALVPVAGFGEADLSVADKTVRTTAALTSQLRTKLPGATLRKKFDNVGWTLVDIPPGMTTDQALATMKAKLGAKNVASNDLLHACATPNDPYYGEQWWLNKIAAPTAWDITKGSDSIVVAVIDTGAQLDHPDLKDRLWKNPGEIADNGKDDDGNGYVDDVYGINTISNGQPPSDDEGHGTFCASVIGASTNNATQVAGVNWNVKIMPLRFLDAQGNGSTAGAADCLDYVVTMKKRGVNVLVTSNSWAPNPDAKDGGASQVLHDAFAATGAAGVISMVAAGNGDNNNNAIDLDAHPQYPSSYTDDSIVSVAASDEDDSPTYFSNYGATTVDLAAPGAGILALDLNSSTTTLSGTSMSTPMVAGAAALLLSKEGGLSVSQVKNRILSTVDKIPAWAGKTVTGGRLNLTRMLNNAANGLPSISGLVFRDRAGSQFGIAGVTLSLKLGKQVVRSFTTSSDGTYSFTNLQAGTYTLAPVLSGFKFVAQTVVISSDSRTANFEGISKQKLYAISGVALGPDNLPREGVQIFSTTTKGSTLLATTGANGTYVIYDRPSGTYRLTAQGANLEWFPTPTALKLPARTSNGDGVINFAGLPPDTEAPSISIVSPSNNAVVKVNSAPKVSIIASDRSGVDKLYYTLTNTTSGNQLFYNWKTKRWTGNSVEVGVTALKDVNGSPVNLAVTLPKLAAGTYLFQVYGSDTKGNTTLAGNETTVTITASSTGFASVKNS